MGVEWTFMGAYAFDNGGCFEVGVVTRGPLPCEIVWIYVSGLLKGKGWTGSMAETHGQAWPHTFSLAAKVGSKMRWDGTLRTISKVLFESSAGLHVDGFEEDFCCHQVHRG